MKKVIILLIMGVFAIEAKQANATNNRWSKNGGIGPVTDSGGAMTGRVPLELCDCVTSPPCQNGVDCCGAPCKDGFDAFLNLKPDLIEELEQWIKAHKGGRGHGPVIHPAQKQHDYVYNNAILPKNSPRRLSK